MTYSTQISLIACGLFFVTGLLTGVWKYRHMMSSPNGTAPVYVDICHRSALMYAFACHLIGQFTQLSAWPELVNSLAVLAQVTFFATAVANYAVHGFLQDTDNMLQRPHVLGSREIPGRAVHGYVYLLILGEVGGFLVIFAGFVVTLAA